MKDSEKTFRFLALFGLSPVFTQKELHHAYRTLAKLNHPDTSEDPESSMRMVIINEAYSFLKNISQTDYQLLSAGRRTAPDPAYVYYKTAFEIMSKAFTDYFGEGDKSKTDDLKELRKELLLAKNSFAECIHLYPKSQWTPDAIDRVFSINKWLD
jgi:curved DNA-binding protein CbpA